MGGTSLTGLYRTSVRRPGKPILHYVYAWRGGPCIAKSSGGLPPSIDDAALALLAVARADRHAVPTDTIHGLATAWRASPEWRAYAPDTRKQWGHKLSALEAKWGKVPVAVFEDRRVKAKIVAWRDALAEAHGARGADMHIQVLRALLAFAVVRGLIGVNLALGIPGLYRSGSRAMIIWEPVEREVMEVGLEPAVADAFRLACLTGLRRGDLVRLPLSACGEHAIVWRTQKSRGERVVTVPMIAPLAALIEDLRGRTRAPGVETLLVNSRGQAWTPDGLDSSFGVQRDRIGFDKHLHDCRGTYITELCVAGSTDREIAGIAGWSETNVAAIRRIDVDQARTVVAIGERLANAALSNGLSNNRR